MSSPIKKIAIVGATGNMGKHTITELLKRNNHSITALTRKSSNISVPSSVKVIGVDYDSIDNLTSALQGQDLLMITLAVTTPPHVHQNLVSAAAAAGIKYIIPNAYGYNFLDSAINADIPWGNLAHEYFASIESKGMVHFSLICGFWYEWSLGIPWCYGIDIVNKKAVFYDDGMTKMNTSTWELCGKAIAELVSLPEEELEKFKNKSLYISSFKVSQREMLDSVHRVLGTKDEDWDIRYEGTKERYNKGIEDMKNGDRTGFGRAMYARVFYPDGSGDYESSKGLDNESLNLPDEELDEATKRTVELVNSGWNPYG
ncbi:NAD(P)-binding protein, partial [Aureobasidium melanogenum]